ncbi:MAG: hypothetical protein AB7J63_09755 [Vicinamibacterales bacterium]
MSFSLTTPQILDASKTVTRRLGWTDLAPGTLFCAVRKGMGLKKGEKVERLKVLRAVNVWREPLDRLLFDDAYGRREVIREGFPELTPAEFVRMFCRTHRGCTPQTVLTRIEFSYEPPNQASREP